MQKSKFVLEYIKLTCSNAVKKLTALGLTATVGGAGLINSNSNRVKAITPEEDVRINAVLQWLFDLEMTCGSLTYRVTARRDEFEQLMKSNPRTIGIFESTIAQYGNYQRLSISQALTIVTELDATLLRAQIIGPTAGRAAEDELFATWVSQEEASWPVLEMPQQNLDEEQTAGQFDEHHVAEHNVDDRPDTIIDIPNNTDSAGADPVQNFLRSVSPRPVSPFVSLSSMMN